MVFFHHQNARYICTDRHGHTLEAQNNENFLFRAILHVNIKSRRGISHSNNMGLDARVCCVLVVYEETAPLPVNAASSLSDSEQMVHTNAKTKQVALCDCQDSTCICRFNVTNILPLLPMQCHELSAKGACGRCHFCAMMRNIEATPELRSLTNIYCCGVVVLQRGYLVPDYCNPIFKCLFQNDRGANTIHMEAMVWTKLNTFFKHYIKTEVLKMFHCGVRDARCVRGKSAKFSEHPISSSSPATMSSSATTPTHPAGPNDLASSVLPTKSIPKPRLPSTPGESRKFMPCNVLTNTTHKHQSMSHGVHQQLFSSTATLARSKGMVGSNWGFMEGRSNLDCNSTMLLQANQAVRVSHADIQAQFEPPNVAEGSAFSLGEGEIAVSFPMIAMFHTSAGTALTLKASAYAVPLYSLYSMQEMVLLRISCEPIGTHKSFANREYLCFPLRVRSKMRADNTKLIEGARHAVVTWPEILFRLNNKETPFKFMQPRRDNVLCFGIILPNFLAIFMDEFNVYAAQSENIDTEISRRYTTKKEWNEIQTIPVKEKYLLIMLMGSHDALRMLLRPSKLEMKLRRQKIPQKKYENIGTSITSAFAIAFTLSCHMKFLYDIAYDFCLNLLAVAAGNSGWHNSDIQRDCAKMMRLQDLLAPNAVSTFSADDSLVLGQQVTTRVYFD